MPTKQQVIRKVESEIQAIAHLKPTPDQVLADPPLRMDPPGLSNLALALRKFVKDFDPGQTVTATEVRKSGLTVQGLIDLILQKLGI